MINVEKSGLNHTCCSYDNVSCKICFCENKEICEKLFALLLTDRKRTLSAVFCLQFITNRDPHSNNGQCARDRSTRLALHFTLHFIHVRDSRDMALVNLCFSNIYSMNNLNFDMQ